MKKEREISSLLFNNIYQIEKKISEGSFGTVYSGFNRKNSQKVAIKVEKSQVSTYDVLYKEAQTLNLIQGIEGIPKFFFYGEKLKYKVMVIELLGLDLLHFYKRFRRFSLKTVCKIAFQLIKILYKIHEKGVLHRDLKPENITIGLEKASNILYLIDFGISKQYLVNGKHIAYQEGRPFIGTIRFASIAAHKGVELSRKDDLESLGYLLIFFLKGRLPWQTAQKMTQRDRKEMVANLKEKTKVEELCHKLPETFTIYLKYVRNLSFKEIPNYGYLKDLFSKLAEEKNFDLEDNLWDWSENNSNLKTFPSKKSLESSELLSQNFEKLSSIPKETLDKIEEEKTEDHHLQKNKEKISPKFEKERSIFDQLEISDRHIFSPKKFITKLPLMNFLSEQEKQIKDPAIYPQDTPKIDNIALKNNAWCSKNLSSFNSVSASNYETKSIPEYSHLDEIFGNSANESHEDYNAKEIDVSEFYGFKPLNEKYEKKSESCFFFDKNHK